MQRFHGSISVSLTDLVFEKKIAIVGTMPHDRKGIPKELKEVSNRNEKSIICLHHEKKILYIDKKTQVRKRHCFDSNARQCKYSKVSTAETTCSCNVLHTKGRADVTDLLSTNHSTRIKSKRWPLNALAIVLDTCWSGFKFILRYNNIQFTSSEFAEVLGKSLLLLWMQGMKNAVEFKLI